MAWNLRNLAGEFKTWGKNKYGDIPSKISMREHELKDLVVQRMVGKEMKRVKHRLEELLQKEEEFRRLD